MIHCRKCTEIPEFNIKAANVYVSLPTHLHVEVLQELMSEMNLELEQLSDAYLVKTNSFESLVMMLANRYFDMMEQKDVMMLPLYPEESLHFRALTRFKSLYQWHAWFQGSALVDILQRKSLKIEFQPIVEVSSGEIYAYEALSRGIRVDGTTILPIELFQMARDMGLLFNLDRLCRETIIVETAKRNITKKMFINFNPNSIYDPEKCLRSTIAEINRYGLREEQFVFEVLENERVEDYDHLKSILDFYRKKGYGVAIDDVGCGFNTLDTLHALHPNYLKIAREVIQDIHLHKSNQERLHEYVQTAKEKGIKVIAEGVEVEAEYQYVRQAGVDFVQGYYVGFPSEIPVQEIFIK